MSSPALRIQNLHKSFSGTTVVNDLSFEMNEGEIFGLLGPNGAGKSTTINMIGGVCRIGRGSVEIFGYDNRRDYRTTRRLVGVMHQEIVIDNFFTIDRALKIHSGYYGVPDDRPWREMLIDRLGLEPHLHKVMIKLSGGLKRRFMIAKALIHRPRLLILDEPTAGVDVELRHGLWDFVREINKGGTSILLTTHYLEEAEEMCDRIAIMNEGELLTLETTEKLIEHFGGRSLTVHLKAPLETSPAELDRFCAHFSSDRKQLNLSVPDGATAMDLMQRLCSLGLDIVDFETRQPNLEEVFLQITAERQRGGKS